MIKAPLRDGTVKVSAGIPPELFERQMALIGKRRAAWLEKAEKATPALLRTAKKPQAVITVTNDPASFQGWRIGASAEAKSVYDRPLKPGDGSRMLTEAKGAVVCDNFSEAVAIAREQAADRNLVEQPA